MPGSEPPPPPATVWFERQADGTHALHLYFFWSETCPHCRRAKPFIENLPRRHPWIKLHSLEVSRHPENARRFVALAESLGTQARAVPALFYCGQQRVGFDRPETTGARLLDQLIRCRNRQSGVAESPKAVTGGEAPSEPLILPVLGPVDPSEWSLPFMTLVIAGLDAFNPCAFFVLMFLLSLLIHARRRVRMLIIGGTFVLFSGLIYFLFMAAWLNLFLWAGELKIITAAAGIMALFMGGVNLKDYFWFQKGISLSIPEKAKPGLFQRMRNLAQASNLATMLVATAALAIAANSYELLCTAGFPMVFTRLLTLRSLSTAEYYFYLAAYNVIYIIPLACIVAVFTWTLGSRKLQEKKGRFLKMLSGWMMLGFGGLLLFLPDWIQNLWSAFLLVLLTVFLTWLVTKLAPRTGTAAKGGG